jgi:hypothetical protein
MAVDARTARISPDRSANQLQRPNGQISAYVLAPSWLVPCVLVPSWLEPSWLVPSWLEPYVQAPSWLVPS